MLVAALRHRGEDYLVERPGPWTGSPLLYPWANRLSAERFTVRGRTVDASLAHRDENGVPIHGLPEARRGWVVERSISWLLGCRRLGVRYERRADLLQGLLHLACALICLTFLAPMTT